MASLPLELIEHICSLLCPHCQRLGIFSDIVTEDTRSSQKALAHLCRVSRRVCAVAQPFLFHQYCTGNLPAENDCGLRGHARCLPREDDKLPAFLHSIISRPDLSFHVRTLQIVETDEISGLTPDLSPLIFTASQKVRASHHAPTQEHLRTQVWQESRQPEALQRINRRKVHHWLEELAILLTPKVEMISIARDSFCQYQHIKDSGVLLPSLRLITLRGVTRNQHVHEAAALFKAAPNLKVLNSMQCSLFDGLSPWNMSKPWTLSLGSLKRLVLSEIGFEDLALLLACCPKLRELELTAVNIHRTAGIDYWDVSKLLQTLVPVRHQLRKLRLTHSPSQRSGAEQRQWTDETSLSFRDFVQLEELAFDHTMLEYHTRPTAFDDEILLGYKVSDMLPTSLQKLQLLHVKKESLKDLKHLAGNASYRLPSLKLVHISFADGIDKRDVGYKRIDDITVALQSAGMSVLWDTNHVSEKPLEPIPGGVTALKSIQVSLATAGIDKLAL
ncbi:F-box domain protein [Colletotrichum chrysophilum]|uniref:F-box domain protein n=1 Tax=Colletotrichum chrysophilum TaxID=1836956 RepID=A0AAD9ATH5_9PEZI|nr:F-box domain protein [Colletotrichum chrysophilum]